MRLLRHPIDMSVPKQASAAGMIAVAALAGLAVSSALAFAGLHLVRITSASMEPAVMAGSLVVVYERPVDIARLERGAIALFNFPIGSDSRAIKRVVALPGDLVEVRDDAVLVNGRRIAAPAPLTRAQGFELRSPSAVAPGNVFLLGDNASASIDSRSFGPAPIGEIRGTVLFALPFVSW